MAGSIFLLADHINSSIHTYSVASRTIRALILLATAIKKKLLRDFGVVVPKNATINGKSGEGG